VECAWRNNGETSQCRDNVINQSNGKKKGTKLYMYAQIISFT